MKEEAATDALLRQFLLGTVADEERQRIESVFLTDPRMRERVLAAEQQLIDDYLEESLSTADRERFLSQYGETVAQRRKLRIAQSIHEWAAKPPTIATATAVVAPATSMWRRLLAGLRAKSVLVIPIAATAAVVIVIALLWVNSGRRERERQHFALEQELAQLNTPARLRETQSSLPPLTLKPGPVRGVESQPELNMRRDSSAAELRLLWLQKEDYQTYTATLRRVDDDQSYTVPALQADNSNGKAIRLRLPAHMLSRGTYQIQLSGISADGRTSPPEVYSFTVSE